MKMTLSQIVDAVLLEQQGKSGAIKLAEEQEGGEKSCEKCGKPAMVNSEYCKQCAEKESRKEEEASQSGTEKTSSERVEKLASAVEYLLNNPEWTGVAGRIKVGSGSATETSKTVGAGKGPNALPTNVDGPISGTQSENVGEAKTKIPEKQPLVAGAPNPGAPANAVQDNIGEMKASYPEQGVLKQSSVRDRYIRAMLKNAGSEDNEEETNKLSSPTSTVLPENKPSEMKRPAEATRQEQLISSNKAVIDATKREAKAEPKKQLGEVLQEKAQTSSTDKVLNENLGASTVNAAGAKIAAARTLIEKVAGEGCTCTGSGACGFCKIASKMRSKKGLAKGSQFSGGGNPSIQGVTDGGAGSFSPGTGT